MKLALGPSEASRRLGRRGLQMLWNSTSEYQTTPAIRPDAQILLDDFQTTHHLRKKTRHPRLVITIQTCTAMDPATPNDSFMTPAYVVELPILVNLIKNSTEMSTSQATAAIRTIAGITPRTLVVAGMDMIPAPIILVETLKTAPGTDPYRVVNFPSGSNGTWDSAFGDISALTISQAGSN